MKILIIDSNYLCHRARHTTGLLSYKGMPTGVIFGFLNQLFTLGQAVRPDEMVFIWDSKKSNRRSRFPFYKDRKHEEPDPDLIAAFSQFAKLRCHILPELGFHNNFIQSGYEADDLIAKLVMEERGHSFITASGDQDLYQLLDYTDMYSMPKSVQIKHITKQTFIEEYGIQPKDWVKVKQIAGCNSDTVPGIKGVGEATAIKYMLGQLKPESVKYKAIEAGGAIIKRNEWLVKLPLPGTKKYEINKSQFDKFRLRGLCKELGFTKLYNDHNKLDEWNTYFGGDNE
jgi:5'-3' exonuclease